MVRDRQKGWEPLAYNIAAVYCNSHVQENITNRFTSVQSKTKYLGFQNLGCHCKSLGCHFDIQKRLKNTACNIKVTKLKAFFVYAKDLRAVNKVLSVIRAVLQHLNALCITDILQNLYIQ